MKTGSILPAGNAEVAELGGGLSPHLLAGEEAARPDKISLILARVLRNESESVGRPFIDMGTDYRPPVAYDDYGPTQIALEALAAHADSSGRYPSSYGLVGLRESFAGFMGEYFGVELDPHAEVMINTGATQVFDALTRSYSGRHVAIPHLALPTVTAIARGNCAEVFRLRPNSENPFIDIDNAQEVVDTLPDNSIRYLYFNSPHNPTGRIASEEYLSRLTDFARRNSVLLLHDMDSWYTTHNTSQKAANVLQIAGSKDTAVTYLSISKEFGLPGVRVGFLAGNPAVIEVVRRHNSTFSEMIPEPCQYAAMAAIEAFMNDGCDKSQVNAKITQALEATLDGWRSLGWPEDGIHPPEGGYKYLVDVPPGVKQGAHDPFIGLDLLAYYMASRGGVNLSTSRPFNPEVHDYIRVVVTQDEETISEAFRRLEETGVNYDMELPAGLGDEYARFIAEHIKADF